MPVVDSRLGPGTLTFGTSPIDATFQASTVSLMPENSQEDGTPTLGVPKPAPITTTSWSLEGSVLQDWEDPNGFQAYCFNNAEAEVDFEFVPNTDETVAFTGRCVISPLQIGGEVAVQSTVDFSFGIVGDPVWGVYTP